MTSYSLKKIGFGIEQINIINKVKSPAITQFGEKNLKAHSYFPAPVLFQYFYEI